MQEQDSKLEWLGLRTGLGWGTAAVGAAVCVAAPPAKGAVVYTAANIPVGFTANDQSVDLDGDGNGDYFLDYSAAGMFSTETNLKIDGNVAGTSEFAIDSTLTASGSVNVAAFSTGTQIGASLPGSEVYSPGTVGPYTIALGIYGGGNLYTPDTDPAPGNFPTSAGAEYIGLQFTAVGNATTTPNYGYILYETTDGSSDAALAGEILGYAYETQPGVAITAGAVPEPASLALLAMGAAGLARYRDRRIG